MSLELHRVQDVVNELSRRITIRKYYEAVHIIDAVGKIALEDIIAVNDLPPTDKSVLDGFAVRSIDVLNASVDNPAILELCHRACDAIRHKLAIPVSTGDPLPLGADAVVPIEYAEVKNSKLYVYKPINPGYGVAKRGEDIKKGDLIVKKGTILRPWHIAALASQGINKVKVLGNINVAIFSTGDELVEPGSELAKGKVYNSTKYIVASSLKELNFRIIDLGIVPDDEIAIKRKFIEALNIADIVISTGGTSLGKRDLTVKTMSTLNNLEYFVHGVNIIPGKPCAFGVINGKVIACLSGYPVAALIELEFILLPSVFRSLGLANISRYIHVRARAKRRIASRLGMMNIIRGRIYNVGNELEFEPLKLTGSGVLSTLLKSNALLIIDETCMGIEKGDLLDLILISDPIKI